VASTTANAALAVEYQRLTTPREGAADRDTRQNRGPLEDPKGKRIERVREIRAEIRDRVQARIEHEGWRA
jgi:hypothetical protein